LPGDFLALSTSSFTELIPVAGFTTISSGDDDTLVMPTRSEGL
jgi:hypothetical protein